MARFIPEKQRNYCIESFSSLVADRFLRPIVDHRFVAAVHGNLSPSEERPAYVETRVALLELTTDPSTLFIPCHPIESLLRIGKTEERERNDRILLAFVSGDAS